MDSNGGAYDMFVSPYAYINEHTYYMYTHGNTHVYTRTHVHSHEHKNTHTHTANFTH